MEIKKGMVVKLRKLTRDQWCSLEEVCAVTRDDAAEIFGSRYTGHATVSSITRYGNVRISISDHITVDNGSCRYWLPRWCLIEEVKAAEKPSAWAARWAQMMEA